MTRGGAQGAQAILPEGKEAAQVHVIAVNDSYRLAPFADVCYFADEAWWKWHKDRPDFIAFAGQKCSIQATGQQIEDPDVHIIRNAGPDGLSLDPEALCTGRNSGFQAINLAVLAGAATIILLGYDGKVADLDGSSHFFGHHPKREAASVYGMYCSSFRSGAAAMRAAGARVINCSPDSAVDAFERMPLDVALAL